MSGFITSISELDILCNKIDAELRRSVAADPREVNKRQLDDTLTRLAKRRTEGVRLFQAFPHAVSFLDSKAKWRLAVGSNQSSKTTHAVYDLCRFVTGKEPGSNATGARALVVALDWGDIADPIYRKMFEPGVFPVIRDSKTGLTRAVRIDPNDPKQVDPDDWARRVEWRDSEPFIPERMIRNVNWYDFSAKQPYRVELTNDAVISFRSSRGRPKRGSVFDRVLFDEQLENVDWYYETARGMMAKHGRAVWSATWQDCSPCLQELYMAAERGADWVQVFPLYLADNPFLTAEEKRIFEELLPEEQRETRIEGRPPIAGRRVYAGVFKSQGIHGCEPFEVDPSLYTRFAFVDPGSHHCGTVLVAVDPDEQFAFVYDSFDLADATGASWSAVIKERERGYKFEAFVIDSRAGVQRPFNMDVTVATNLWDKLMAGGVKPRMTDSVKGLGGFFAGNANVAARERCLLDMMRVRDAGPFAGTARLQMLRGQNPTLERQIVRAYYSAPDKRVTKYLTEDLLDCLEYVAAFSPYYRLPERSDPTVSTDAQYDDRVSLAWKRKQQTGKHRRNRVFVEVA